MFYFATFYYDKSKKKLPNCLYFDIASLQLYYKCVVVVYWVLLKEMLDMGNVLLKKLFTVIYAYTFIYAYLVLRCTTLFANEHNISTFKSSIYVVTNQSRKIFC